MNPAANDVLFGRDSGANIHPGSIQLRQDVLEKLNLYKASSKEEKYHIITGLLRSFKNDGHRFLAEDKMGLWCEEVRKGVHPNVSQIFRDTINRRANKKCKIAPTATCIKPRIARSACFANDEIENESAFAVDDG